MDKYCGTERQDLQDQFGTHLSWVPVSGIMQEASFGMWHVLPSMIVFGGIFYLERNFSLVFFPLTDDMYRITRFVIITGVALRIHLSLIYCLCLSILLL